MAATIWYLFHSGFAVRTANHFLIFDYWKSTPKNAGLEAGVIDPAVLSEDDVIVFVSHGHGDHYNREILRWPQKIPKLRLVLSSDIPSRPGAVMMGPGQRKILSDIAVETFTSNDEGVAFLVEVDGLCVYHAGDLNWWHWEGEPEAYNMGMAKSYKEQIDRLNGKSIDIAFVPVDPRLEAQYAWGIDYLMRTADVHNVIPMHFDVDSSVTDRLLRDPVSEKYRDRIKPLTQRGQSIQI